MILYLKKSMDERFTYLVEKYLDNDLSVTEKAVFEKYLEDPACRKYLENAEKIEKVMKEEFGRMQEKAQGSGRGARGMETGEEDDIPEEIKLDVLKYGGKDDPVARGKVRRMHEQMIRRGRIRVFLKYILPAASLLVGVYFLFTDYFKPVPQSLFRARYKSYEFKITGTETIQDKRIMTAMSMYESGDYQGSTGLCRDIIASGTEEDGVRFLYGLNLMALDSIKRAIQEFDAQINSPSLTDADKQLPVYRYKSLCYLKLGKPFKALREIMKPYYRKFRKNIH